MERFVSWRSLPGWMRLLGEVHGFAAGHGGKRLEDCQVGGFGEEADSAVGHEEIAAADVQASRVRPAAQDPDAWRGDDAWPIPLVDVAAPHGGIDARVDPAPIAPGR